MTLSPSTTQEVGVDYTTLDLISQLFALQGDHLSAISEYIEQHCMLTGDLGVPLRLLQPSYVEGRDNAIQGFSQGREIAKACLGLIDDTRSDYAAIDAQAHDAKVRLGALLGITIPPYSPTTVTAELLRGEPGMQPGEDGGNVVLDAYGKVVDAREWVDAAETIATQSPFRMFTDSSDPPSRLDRFSASYLSDFVTEKAINGTVRAGGGTRAIFDENQNDLFQRSVTSGQDHAERARDWTQDTIGSGRSASPPSETRIDTGAAPPDRGATSATSTSESSATRTTLGPESAWLNADQTRVVGGTLDAAGAAWGLTDSIVDTVEAGQGLGDARAGLDAMRDLAERPASTNSINWARGGQGW